METNFCSSNSRTKKIIHFPTFSSFSELSGTDSLFHTQLLHLFSFPSTIGAAIGLDWSYCTKLLILKILPSKCWKLKYMYVRNICIWQLFVKFDINALKLLSYIHMKFDCNKRKHEKKVLNITRNFEINRFTWLRLSNIFQWTFGEKHNLPYSSIVVLDIFTSFPWCHEGTILLIPPKIAHIILNTKVLNTKY